MSDDIDINYGGAISVDTEALRDVGSRMARLAWLLDDARAAIGRAHGIIIDTPELSRHVNSGALWASRKHTGKLRGEIDDASAGTLLMADAYEVVELRAQAEALSLTDAAAAEAIRARMGQLMASDPRVALLVALLLAKWKHERFDGLDRQFDPLGLMGVVFGTVAGVGTIAGLGKVLPGETLQGKPDPVTVTAVKTSHPKHPPANFEEALRRFPTASGAQVRVEKYTMADGSTQYVAYVAGTRNGNPLSGGGSEPWDMKSNAELYTGQTSASYQATLDALAAAGAKPGDRVDVFGYSQGGMIATHLAMETGYKVDVVVTVGSPTEPTLRDDQMLVQLGNTDDRIRAMAGGGSPGGTGSPNSVTVTRVGDPAYGVQDVGLKPHMIETYIETAKQLDASGDPRVEAASEYFDQLGKAVEIESTQFRAERVGQ